MVVASRGHPKLVKQKYGDAHVHAFSCDLCRQLAVVVMTVVAIAAPARAASAFEARGSTGTFVADDGLPLGHLTTAGQLRLVWNKDPIVRRSKDGVVLNTVVEHQLDSQLVVGLGLFSRFELAAQLTGRMQTAPGDGAFELVKSASPVAPRLSARLLALDLGWLQASARLRGALMQDVEPGMILVLDPGWARFTFDGGVAVTPTAVQLPFALSASVPLHERLSVTAEVFGSAASMTRIPVEAMAGVRGSLGNIAVVAGVGGGLIADVGTPAVRLAVAVQWHFDLSNNGVGAVMTLAEPARSEVAEEPIVVVSGADDVADVADVDAVAAADVPAAEIEGADSADVIVDNHGVTFADDVVLFPADRDTLLPAGRRLLRIVARNIKSHPEITKVVIEGHSDALGASAFNRRLSSWRAEAVRRSLIAWGVAPERLTVRALGAAQPIASNRTAAGRRQNRRVEITFENADAPLAAPTSHNAGDLALAAERP